MLKQFLLASFACALAVVSGFGVSTKAEAKPVYTVAMDAAYPPFGSQDLKSKEYHQGDCRQGRLRGQDPQSAV